MGSRKLSGVTTSAECCNSSSRRTSWCERHQKIDVALLCVFAARNRAEEANVRGAVFCGGLQDAAAKSLDLVAHPRGHTPDARLDLLECPAPLPRATDADCVGERHHLVRGWRPAGKLDRLRIQRCDSLSHSRSLCAGPDDHVVRHDVLGERRPGVGGGNAPYSFPRPRRKHITQAVSEELVEG